MSKHSGNERTVAASPYNATAEPEVLRETNETQISGEMAEACKVDETANADCEGEDDVRPVTTGDVHGTYNGDETSATNGPTDSIDNRDVKTHTIHDEAAETSDAGSATSDETTDRSPLPIACLTCNHAWSEVHDPGEGCEACREDGDEVMYVCDICHVWACFVCSNSFGGAARIYFPELVDEANVDEAEESEDVAGE